MANIETVKYTLPAYLGCALINDDGSSLSQSEIDKLCQFVKDKSEQYNGFYCIGCSEETFFTKTHDYYLEKLAADCLIFTFQINIR